jgi:DNA invertase Pin-like site-specific DNA recombinase
MQVTPERLIETSSVKLPTGLTEPSSIAIEAVAYVRMSTEHQQYSTQNQMSAIRSYASAHGMSISQVYSDDGISGLRIENRSGLQNLIADVLKPDRRFARVLVYDISRWGRFQDTDQSAYYEYLCRMNGADVIYCAEPFENDHSPLSAVVKAVKRAMAAEYSRELSVKTFRGHCNLASYGYAQGGPSPYGLKHVLVGLDGKPISDAFAENRKILRGRRIVLAPGPMDEIQVVRQIFHRYVDLGDTPSQIASELNKAGARTRRGQRWYSSFVRRILTDEQYVGTAVYNKTCSKLKGKRKHNSPRDWIRKPVAFEAVVERDTFDRAQQRMRGQFQRPSNEEVISKLKRLLAKRGHLSEAVINESRDLPSSGIYRYRFGSMLVVYGLIGYTPRSNLSRWNKRFWIRDVRTNILKDLDSQCQARGVVMRTNASAVQFKLNDQLTCSFQISASFQRSDGPRWLIRRTEIRAAMLHLIGRVGRNDGAVIDFFLVSNERLRTMPRTMQLDAGPEAEIYRIVNPSEVVDRLIQKLGSLPAIIG